MTSSRSRTLFWTWLVFLLAFGAAQFAAFLHFLYGMKYHGESQETLLIKAFAVGRATAPLLIGLIAFAAWGISISRDTRGGPRPDGISNKAD